MKKYIKSITVLLFFLLFISAVKAVEDKKAVGKIPLQYSNSQNGSVTYNVPIQIYPGRDNFQPNISLIYSSMSSSGTAGVGWSLNALSTITAVPSNIYYNGEISPVYNSLPELVLDGVRLIFLKKEDTKILYQSEQGNIYAEKDGDEIVVYYPDTRKALFRKVSIEPRTINNRINDRSTVYTIQSISDILGNRIEYFYIHSNNIDYISEIKYGLKDDGEYFAAVKFNYEDRDDINFAYTNGVKYVFEKRLNSIHTFYEGALLRTYNLTYLQRQNASLLKQIDCSVNNESLPPLIFDYGEGNMFDLTTEVKILEDYEKSYRTEYIFDEESETDIEKKIEWENTIHPFRSSETSRGNGLIIFPDKEFFKKHKEGFYFSQYKSEDHAYIYEDVLSQNKPTVIDLVHKDSKAYGREINAVLMIDKDGKDHLLTVQSFVDYQKEYSEVNISIQDKGKLISDFKISINGTFDAGKIKNAPPRLYFTGDFTGCGSSNLLILTPEMKDERENQLIKPRVTYVDIENRTKEYETTSFHINNNDMIFALDFNGDGRTEICKIGLDGLKIYSFSVKKGFTLLSDYSELVTYLSNSSRYNSSAGSGGDFGRFNHVSRIDTTMKIKYTNEFFINDLNGDGILDFLIAPKGIGTDQKKWIALYGNGNFNFEKKTFEFIKYDYGVKQHYYLHDINGDGLPDLIDNTRGGTPIVYLNSNGIFDVSEKELDFSGLVEGSPQTRSVIEGKYYPNIFIPSTSLELDYSSKIMPCDMVNSAGIPSLVSIHDEKITFLVRKSPVAKENMISKVADGTGVKVEHKYKSLNDKNIHEITNVESSLFKNYGRLLSNVYVLDKTFSYLGDNVNSGKLISSFNYKYINATIHKRKGVSVGFEKMIVIDNIRHKTASTTFDPYKWGVIKEEDSSNTKIKYLYKINSKINKTMQILLVGKSIEDKLTGTSSMSFYQHDEYGNIIKEVSNLNGSITLNITNQYINEKHTFKGNNPYVLGLLTLQTTVKSRDGHSQIEKNTIDYNSVFLPTSTKSYINNALLSSETFMYDGKWNLKEKLHQAYQGNVFSNKFEYDEYGKLIKETDPMNFSTKYVYNSKGLLAQKWNHQGFHTSYKYDNWDRVIEVRSPDNISIETTKYEWDNSMSKSLYTITSEVTGQPTSKVYFDALGRNIREGGMRLDGNFLYTDTEYDEKGQVFRISLPFKGNIPKFWNSYTYNDNGQIIELNYATGKKDVFSYDKVQTTSVIDGIETKTIKDASGLITHVIDPAGIIEYKYRADDQLSYIIAPGNIKTSFNYDVYGRQIELIDPSAGKKSFKYDQAGNLIEEIDANGKSVKYTYDLYDRVKTKQIADNFTTTYAYNNEGLLASEKSTNGTGKEYSYDDYFRPTSVHETIMDGKSFQKNYSYEDNNVVGIDYFNHLGLMASENIIYSHGSLTQRKIDGVSYWNQTKENDLGLIDTGVSGTIMRTYSYNEYGIPIARKASCLGVKTIQDFRYEFDNITGNLKYREDLSNVSTTNQILREDFTYDKLNRLTSISSKVGNSTAKEIHMVYDGRGNLLDNSSVGQFGYVSGDPYAVALVTPYGDAVAMRTQNITYNAQMRPTSISENGYAVNFKYNTDGDRVKMLVEKDGKELYNRYYLGGQYEIVEKPDNTIQQLLYLGGDAYSAPAVYINEGNKWDINFILRDYLGSITHITNKTGLEILQTLSYDAWGRLRDPETLEVYKIDEEPELLLSRGYTGHEHLSMFGLINMNARLYDPVLGRFLSPDPYVQSPFDSQNFNRYSYALNNPLRYTDESGEAWFHVAAFIIGGTINVISNWNNIHSWQEGLSYFAVGGTSALVSAFIPNPVGFALSGVIASGGNELISQTQGFQNLDNISWNQVGYSSILGGVTGATMGIYGKALDKPLNAVFGKIASPLLKNTLTETTRGAITGFSLNTAVALGNGDDLDEAFSQGWKGATWGMAIGAGSGAYRGYIESKTTGKNFWTGKPTVGLTSINSSTIHFGQNANQEYHTFRHIDELGLNKLDVKNAILSDFSNNITNVRPNVPNNFVITHEQTRLQYTVFQLSDGSYNIGRIHGIP